MNRFTHATRPYRAAAVAPLAASLLLLTACSARTADETSAAPAAIASRPSSCWSFTPTKNANGSGWYPVREGIAITPDEHGSAMNVAYRRTRGKPAGVAFELSPGSCERLRSVALRMAATPEQRLSICLTDGAGVVWTFPSVKAVGDIGDFALLASDVKPDPFQNAGKTVPAAPDWSDMRMLTILDITGFMGAAEADCSWRIELVRGEEGER